MGGDPWQLPTWLLLCCGLSAATYRGREFFTVFPQNDQEGSHPTLQLLLTGYTNTTTTVTVTMQGGTFTSTLTLDRGETVSLRVPSQLELSSARISAKGLLIQATQDITVVSYSFKSYSVGATAVLPVDRLGKAYYVVTPESTTREGLKEFVVAAFKAAASVSILTKGKVYYRGRSYPQGSTLRVTLRPYHSLQLQSVSDLSGTKVTSDQDILVLSGHSCVKVNMGCDYVVEQLLPVEAWGEAYLIPSTPWQAKADLAYVVAHTQATTVTYSGGKKGLEATHHLGAGEVLKLEVTPHSAFHLKASAPVQVVFFFTGATSSTYYQDPFLINLLPTTSYCTSYVVGGLEGYENYLLLVSPTAQAGSTTFNLKQEEEVAWEAIPGSGFSWASIPIREEAQIQTVENREVPFGVMVFGFQSYAGYGLGGLCATPSEEEEEEEEEEEGCDGAGEQPPCASHVTFSTCWATSGPHSRTFDGKTFHFTGACSYTLTKTCSSEPAVPVFHVEAKNQHRGNPKVSYVESVTARLYGLTITAVRAENGVVRVNNRRSHLPISLAQGKLRLYQQGQSLVVSTHFKLYILYNWDDRLLVKLPSTLSGRVCGLCGNANGNTHDDTLTSDGSSAQSPVSLGQVADYNHSHRCWADCSEGCSYCRPEEAARYKGERWCGVLTRHPGPFEGCHPALDPQLYLESCSQELCLHGGFRPALCPALQAYADRCREEGVPVPDWRTPAGCPQPCPDNSTYTPCGTRCPATCNDQALPSSCSSPACLEACECLEGLVLEGSTCIPQEECGCIFEGLLHPPGEEFWGDNACTRRCLCQPGTRRVVCRQEGCRDGEECRVQGGVLGCYPRSWGTCTVAGATRYQSFDGRRFRFRGGCRYQLAGLCQGSGDQLGFKVLLGQDRTHGGSLLPIALVEVQVHGQSVAISRERPGRVTVNGQLVHLPYLQRDKKLWVYRGGLEAVVETDFGLTVTYDWQGRVTVRVPSTYSNALCGLCGNYNGDSEDDLTTQGGQVTPDPDAFGRSWKVTHTQGCQEAPRVECPSIASALQRQESAEKGCKIISDVKGPFRACHPYLDHLKYFQSCLEDFCLAPEGEGAVCQAIASYTAACQAAGVTVEKWRAEDFCSVPCPANSHYEVCSQACSQTCSSLYTPMECWDRCREGCVCDAGFILSGDECVPTAQCGCLYQGFYYKLEETFYPTKVEQCQCKAGGTVECQEVSCPGGREGKVVNGVFQCPPPAPATCVATGDRNYVSFDGKAFNISGTCSYILAETCGGDSVEPFVVKVEKVPRQKKKVSGIQALVVEVHGFTLTLRRGKSGTVMVNSISHRLPATLSEGKVQVYQHGMGVQLEADFGLLVRYDLFNHAAVTVPHSSRGHLCGLCGNYNGRGEDDFLLPSGHQAPSVAAFGSAWKTPGAPCGDACSQDDCPPCTEKKTEVLQQPNYCGILTLPRGPFKSCYHLIDPGLYYRACLHDGCLSQGDTRVLCQGIQSYAAACQEAGATIEAWRRPSFCPPNCPANSSYSLCSNNCANSCAGLAGASRCPERCSEGCSCHQGLLFDGHRCVPREQCGCFEDGRYYEPHESILMDNCHRRCTCVPGKGVTCEDHSCTEDETCDIQDGVLTCVNQNPCKSIRCRPKERCKLKDGKAKCVPSLVSTCWAWGDPHYHTFDGLDFDFQGTCTYTMAESCGGDATLVPFKVEAKNDIRGGVKSVSYVSLATIKVYGHEISIHRREVGKVRVNGVVTLLPVTLEEEKVQLFLSGRGAVLETDFGLRVKYDWNWHLLLDLPSSYYNHTCGLCGNYNLDPQDDIPQSEGDANANAAAVVAWAKEWKVLDDDDPFCWDHCDGDCPVCGEEERELYGGHRYCGLLKKTSQGPFRACHDIIKPSDFYRHCLYDVCIGGGAKRILCGALEAYAATCRKEGAMVHDWRTPAGCPLPCPANSHYEACSTPCPATCTNREAPTTCTQPHCVETCACNPGYVLSGEQCVAVGSCGCTRDGHYYSPGEEFWADDTCQSRCRCDPELGMVVCKEDGCQAGERCTVVKGVRRCVAKSHSVCVATGDPHYTTFDGRRYDFMGTCVYQLAALCTQDNPTLVPFQVTVENNNRGSRVVSYTKEVTLRVYNVTLSLSQDHPQKLKVDGLLMDLPFSQADQLQAYTSGVHGFIRTAFGLTVTFDWHSYARVILPVTYTQAVCGLCGNANGDPRDDLASPDGQQAPNETQFAASWKVADVPGCWAGCDADGDTAGGCKGCSEVEKRLYRGDKHCGLLVKKQGPFAACHGVLDPAPFFADCLFDTCLYKGHQETVCRSVAAYVTACQAQGVALRPWRTAAFCSLPCPPNQHYELCGPSCPATCRGQWEADGCEDTPTTPCSEGCFCDEGFLLSGDRCVPQAQCGCYHQGHYYRLGEEFYPCPRCSERCTCRGDGEVVCQPEGCAGHQVCEVQDGVRGCYSKECGLCQVLGPVSYTTFDGQLLLFAGTCNYTLAAADARGPKEGGGEGGEVAVVPFAVEMEKEGLLIRRLLVTVHGVTVAIARGTTWEVTVGGEQHLLPLTLAGGAVSVSQEGAYRVLRVQDGPRLLYDGASYVLLTLPASYRGVTTGLCGDFNGQPGDDAALPQELGEAWGALTPACTHGAPLAPCPTSSPGPCGLLAQVEGPFAGCHRVVSPQEHLAACVQEQCGDGGGGGAQAVCRSLQAYAAACQAAGGQLQEWRAAANCPLSCPPNSRYALCTHTCRHTCASLSAPPQCSPKCFEGCECEGGFLFNGQECVPPDACGCLHRGRYFEIAETVLSPDCSERCMCRAAGGVQCQAAGCPFGQSCGFKNGARSCVEQPGRCTLVPASRFVSFDGATGQATPTGVYVLASLCDPQHPAWFRLLAGVGEKEDGPAVMALHLFTSRAFVTLKSDKKVWVNGVPAALPTEVSDTLSVTESRGTLWITQKPQLVVGLSPSGEVTVTVTRDLSRGLCGTCGDYDGDAANDRRGPDGKMVDSMAAAAKAWRAPDFTY